MAASFFFDKSGRGTSTGSSQFFVSTLARQLADFNRTYRNTLFRLLDSNPRVFSLTGIPQLRALILDPLQSISAPDDPTLPVIVLDGLDECGNKRDLELLMEMVLELSHLPSNYRVFVGSRPEREVSDAWLHNRVEVHMEDTDRIPTRETQEDISKYIQEKLPQIPSRGATTWPPSLEEMGRFAKQCGGIFEIARIRVRLLQNSLGGVYPSKVFARLLADTHSGLPQFETEYLRILREAYLGDPGMVLDESEEAERREVLERFRRVVGTIITLRHSPDMATLIIFLNMSRDDIASVLRPISSIIEVPQDDPTDPIYFFHATCREFLLGKPTGTKEDEVFFFRDPKGSFLAPICLEFMIKFLQPGRLFNLDHRKGNRALPRGYISTMIHLRYAARHWPAHLELAEPQGLVRELVCEFMSKHVVTWVESVIWSDIFDKVGIVPRNPSHRTQLLKCLDQVISVSAVGLIQSIC